MIYLVFFLGVAFLFVPFIPTYLEVRRQTDATPLAITNHILRDPRANPELIFWHFTQLIGVQSLEALRAQVDVPAVQVINDSTLALPKGIVGIFSKRIARVISAHSIELPSKKTYASKILSLESIKTGEANALNEIHALKNLELGLQNRVIWWASGETVTVQGQSNLPGKIQAKKEIQIGTHTRFHFFQAPVITSFSAVETSTKRLPPPTLAGTAKTFRRESENFEVREDETISDTLIVKGDLKIGANATILGDVKCHGKLTIEKGVRIFGNVVGNLDIEFKGNNWIEGSILSQETVKLGPSCSIGSMERQITCSAKLIRIQSPFKVHGLLRAWKFGTIT